MPHFMVAAVAIVTAFFVARRARRARASSRALAWFAAATLANDLLVEAWQAGWLAGARPLLIAAAALAGLAAWAALMWLVHLHPRRRDVFLRVPLLGIAAIVALTPAPWGVSAGFVCASILCYRWKDGYSSRTLFRLGLLAVLLSVLLLIRLPGSGAAPAEGSALESLARFARWARLVATFYTVAGVVAMFAGFVRDPTLSIRRVGRRLALSHLLVVLVPLGLTALLWAVTTVVGVGAERARLAARVLEHEGAGLERDLTLSLGSGGHGADDLRRAALARADTAGARAWWIEAGRLRRVFGAPLARDSLLFGWFAVSDSVPRAGLVGFAGRTWLGAIAGDPARRAAVVLLPAAAVADSLGARFIGGRVRLLGGLDPGDLEMLADSAHAGIQRERSGGRVRFTFPDDTIDAGTFGGDSSAGAFIPVGQTAIAGVARHRSGWRTTRYVLAITLDPRVVLGELFSRAQKNELDVVPLVLVLFFGGLFGLVALFDFAMVLNMGRSIAGAIGALRRGATQLEAGDLAHRIPVRGEDELWDVARAFNQAIGGLERARDLEKERDRLENELELARRIQSRLLPAAPLRVPGWDIAGTSEPARQVGGDYYDHIDLGGGRLVLVIADVSGKGVPAALLMSAFRAALVSQDLSGAEPSSLAVRLNGFLHQSVEPGRFVTAFVGFLDAATGRFVYVNAGHNPPYVMRADGSTDELSEGGTILGILPGSPFVAGETALGHGDLLALYTDGVTEGANANGEMWGEARLVEALRRLGEAPATRIVATVVDEVRAFEGESGPADDITLLVARRRAPAPGA